jgi:uncharacterized protein (DUF433 family)
MFLISAQEAWGNDAENPWHGSRMAQNTDPASVAKAIAALRTATRRHRTAVKQFEEARPFAKRSRYRYGTRYQDAADALRSARTALHEAIGHSVRAGATQAQVSEVSGFSKAQVSRVARGGTSGASLLPPAEYLIDTLPVDQIAARYRAGESTRELGEAFRCSRATIAALLKGCGIRLDGRPGPPRTPLPDAVILERRKQGESFRQIGRSYGVSGETIRRRIRFL